MTGHIAKKGDSYYVVIHDGLDPRRASPAGAAGTRPAHPAATPGSR